MASPEVNAVEVRSLLVKPRPLSRSDGIGGRARGCASLARGAFVDDSRPAAVVLIDPSQRHPPSSRTDAGPQSTASAAALARLGDRDDSLRRRHLFQCEKHSDAARAETALAVVRGPTIIDGRGFDRKRDADASPVRGSTIPRSNFQGGTSA